MFKFAAALLCPFLILDRKPTTLDQWQAASHVVIVEVESFVHFPPHYKEPYHEFSSYRPIPLWKLKVIEVLTSEKPENDIIYTDFNALSNLKEKERVILAFADFTNPDKINPLNAVYPSLQLLKRELGETIIYAHPYYDPWPLVRNETGEYYLPDCVDGLKEQPLINPLLSEIKQLSKNKIDEKSGIYITGGLYPSEKSNAQVCKCENKQYNE